MALQRDERLGSVLDAQTFAPTVSLDLDCSPYRKWLDDMGEAQFPIQEDYSSVTAKIEMSGIHFAPESSFSAKHSSYARHLN